jgi:hypothetical protein
MGLFLATAIAGIVIKKIKNAILFMVAILLKKTV